MISTLKKIRQSLLVFSAVLSIGVVAFAAPTARAAACVQGNWAYGSSGYCVSVIQTLLNKEGNFLRWPNWSHLNPDGQFGPLTKAQVKAFQAYSGNQQDGQVGHYTWGSLCDTAEEVISAYYDLGAYKSANALLLTAQDAGCGI